MTATDAFAALNRIAGLAPLTMPAFTRDEPAIPTPFRVGEAAGAALGLGASASAEIWRFRGGDRQEIGVDLGAASSSLVSFGLLQLSGQSVPRPSEFKPTVAIYRGSDGRYIHLHGGFPHLEKRTLDLLNADNTAGSIGDAVGKWNAFALEDALAYLNQCGAVVRTEEEWHASEPGKALANTPPIVLRKIGEAPPLRLPESANPLDGIRILDLTRILAGPTSGKTLASYGADVLSVRSAMLPTVDLFDLDTGIGKRSVYLDLSKPADAETLRTLSRTAHVFVDSYRPGALAKLGFSPAALAHANPGIIHLAASCYGHQGPWSNRRGWEQPAQSATGIAMEQGAFMAARAGKRKDTVPRLIPAAACDYITGYLGAAGVIAAILRRIREGGSWQVEVSLCATAMWLQSLDKTDAARVPGEWNPAAGLDGYFQSCETERGRLDYLGPIVRMSKTQPAWHRPPPEPGADKPVWIS